MAEVIRLIKAGEFNANEKCSEEILDNFKFLDTNVSSPSGLTCLQHALSMVEVLDCLEVDADTLNAALLYTLIEYGDLPCEDMDRLSIDTVKLVRGVQTISSINQLYSTSAVHANITSTDAMRRMMLAMVHDGRTVLIKLSEQVVILLNSKQLPKSIQDKVANEAMMIYAPLANRLGLSGLKWQLEDLAFRIQSPDIYNSLSKAISVNRVYRENLVKIMVQKIQDLLHKNNLEAYDCYGRAKHLYSLFKKMQRKKLQLDEIYDAIAIRVIVNNVDDCYAALSIIHDCWEVISHEFDDYIANPKPNGYQSIHTAIFHEGNPVEIQIRTKEMHDSAELGCAAHWLYKEGAHDIKTKSKWLNQLTESSPKCVETEDSNEFERHAIELFKDRVFVFTHTGDVKDLKKGATALDFAYAIHSSVGNRCKGAKVNGQIAPIKTILQNGDRLEILTSKLPSPSRDWLSVDKGYLFTPKARSKVAQWFRQQDQATKDAGKLKLVKFCKAKQLDFVTCIDAVIRKLSISLDVFYYKVGSGDYQLERLLQSYIQVTKKNSNLNNKKNVQQDYNGVVFKDCPGLPLTLANCCFPIPGDAIKGYVTSNRGVVVHRENCKNIIGFDEVRIIEVDWQNTNDSYEVNIYCSCINYKSATEALQKILANEKIALYHLNIINRKSLDKQLFEFRVLVSDDKQMQYLIRSLGSVEGVLNVWR